MNRFFITSTAFGLLVIALAAGYKTNSGMAQTGSAKAKPTPEARSAANSGVAPVMLAFADMNWVDLPERPGMRYAVLSGDPKSSAYTQMRRVPGGTDNGLHRHSNELKNVIISGT